VPIKVLACGEASFLNSGYAVYMRNLLQNLSKYPDLEIAEFGIYGDNDDKRHQNSWKFFGNNPKSEEEKRVFESSPVNEYGAFKFEETVLKFKPDVVFDIRDHWHFVHENHSPLRRYYKWVILPAVDAEPQNPDWINTFLEADGVLTYTDWNTDVLKRQGQGKIKCFGSAPCGTDSNYRIIERNKLKQDLGLTQYPNIIGTVMRNQARKLFPDLFEAFSLFLQKTGRTDTWLWCHTSYPDGCGWDFPYYLQKYNVGHRVIFTYQCLSCGDIEPKPFSDAISVCRKCGNTNSSMTNPSLAIPPESMPMIYNAFDLYVQYANSEGLGIPAIEAGSCGVPVFEVDYSAMSDVVRKLDGTPLKVQRLYHEIQTNCQRALPDNQYLADKLEEFFNKPSILREAKRLSYQNSAKKYFSWELAGSVWYNTIIQVAKTHTRKWDAQPRIYPINNNLTEDMDNPRFVQWLITEVLHEPERLGTYFHSKLLKDVNTGYVKLGNGGNYFNEFLEVFHGQDYQKFGREEAFKMMAAIAQNRNYWEQQRIESLRN
jgi:glycosyltransferase involved in cell wall biosynthesis